jgi:hypothetical protein
LFDHESEMVFRFRRPFDFRRLTKDYAGFGSHVEYKRVLCVCRLQQVQYYIMYSLSNDSDFDELNAYDRKSLRERDLVKEVSAAAAVLAVCVIEARKR